MSEKKRTTKRWKIYIGSVEKVVYERRKTKNTLCFFYIRSMHTGHNKLKQLNEHGRPRVLVAKPLTVIISGRLHFASSPSKIYHWNSFVASQTVTVCTDLRLFILNRIFSFLSHSVLSSGWHVLNQRAYNKW